jgi:hypothetical protein
VPPAATLLSSMISAAVNDGHHRKRCSFPSRPCSFISRQSTRNSLPITCHVGPGAYRRKSSISHHPLRFLFWWLCRKLQVTLTRSFMFQLPENSKAVGLRPCNTASECIPYLILTSLSGSHSHLSSLSWALTRWSADVVGDRSKTTTETMRVLHQCHFRSNGPPSQSSLIQTTVPQSLE